MKKVLIGVVILLALAGGISIALVLCGKESDQAKPINDPAAGFVPRRTRAEIEKGITEARAKRAELATPSASDAPDAEAAQALEMQKKFEAKQTPSGAEAEARARLAEIEQKIAATSDLKERERLEKQKRLVEEVLAKLGKM